MRKEMCLDYHFRKIYFLFEQNKFIFWRLPLGFKFEFSDFPSLIQISLTNYNSTKSLTFTDLHKIFSRAQLLKASLA